MGSLGPLSLEALILGAVQLQILVIWGPYEPPVVVALETQAEILKTAGAWCEIRVQAIHMNGRGIFPSRNYVGMVVFFV